MRRTLSFLLLLSLACAGSTQQRPSTVPQPNVDVRLVNPLFFGSVATAPATIEIAVTNRARVPLTVRRIELDSPGMAQYYLQRYARVFNETIPPGETKKLTAFATAITRTSRPSEPLSIRALIELKAEGATWREVALFRENF